MIPQQNNFLDNFFAAIGSFRPSQFAWLLAPLKFVFFSVSAVLFVCAILLFFKSTWPKKRYLESWVEFLSYHPLGMSKMFKQWSKVTERLSSAREADCKLAIIEADGLLSEALESMGLKGESTGEKLKNLSLDALPDLENVREVHDIRNSIIHDPDYQLTLDQAKKILGTYEKAFRDLEMF